MQFICPLCGEKKRRPASKCPACGSDRADALYSVWRSMKARCENPSSNSYRRYGGRGISVCERWGSYALFLEDMGQRPSPQHSLDRINNDGGYSPDNVRWATRSEQMRNKRDNRILCLDGESLCLAEWAARYGIAAETIAKRIGRGWSIRDAVTSPSPHPKGNPIEFQGETMSLDAWARRMGLARHVPRARLQAGWSVERALTTPTEPRKRRR